MIGYFKGKREDKDFQFYRRLTLNFMQALDNFIMNFQFYRRLTNKLFEGDVLGVKFFQFYRRLTTC